MRTISGALQSHLDSGAATVCRCWLVTRRDGVEMAFTDHDRPLIFQGRAHDPATALEAGDMETSTGLNIDNSQVVGALSADAITEEDMAAGRYDGAEFTVWLVNWADPSQFAPVFAGALGEAKRKSLVFEVELRGLAHALNQPVGRAFTALCGAEFGDAKCGVDKAAHTVASTIVSLDGAQVTVNRLGDFEAGWFSHGVLTTADGQVRRIKAHTRTAAGDVLTLWRGFDGPALLASGDEITVTAGCDRAFASCRDKFANAVNFRGFPHIPGNDWAASWPKSSGRNSGGSLFS